MSVGKSWNAAIALIEGRPQDARELLRSPEMQGVNIAELQMRLEKAVAERADKDLVDTLHRLLHRSLSLEPAEGQSRESFFAGVTAVEKLVEEILATYPESSDGPTTAH